MEQTGPTALCGRCEQFVAPENVVSWTDEEYRIGVCRECSGLDPVV